MESNVDKYNQNINQENVTITQNARSRRDSAQITENKQTKNIEVLIQNSIAWPALTPISTKQMTVFVTKAQKIPPIGTLIQYILGRNGKLLTKLELTAPAAKGATSTTYAVGFLIEKQASRRRGKGRDVFL